MPYWEGQKPWTNDREHTSFSPDFVRLVLESDLMGFSSTCGTWAALPPYRIPKSAGQGIHTGREGGASMQGAQMISWRVGPSQTRMYQTNERPRMLLLRDGTCLLRQFCRRGPLKSVGQPKAQTRQEREGLYSTTAASSVAPTFGRELPRGRP